MRCMRVWCMRCMDVCHTATVHGRRDEARRLYGCIWAAWGCMRVQEETCPECGSPLESVCRRRMGGAAEGCSAHCCTLALESEGALCTYGSEKGCSCGDDFGPSDAAGDSSRMAQLVPNDAGYPSLLLVNQAEALAIGRSHGDLLLRNTAVSSRHCTFWRSAGIVYVEDHSTNGTWVNGKRLDQRTPTILRDGDRVTFPTGRPGTPPMPTFTLRIGNGPSGTSKAKAAGVGAGSDLGPTIAAALAAIVVGPARHAHQPAARDHPSILRLRHSVHVVLGVSHGFEGGLVHYKTDVAYLGLGRRDGVGFAAPAAGLARLATRNAFRKVLLAHHLPICHLARLEVAAGGEAAVYVKKHARKSEAPQGKTLVTGANNVGIEFCALCPAGCGGHISFKFDKARESYVLRKLEPCTCPRSTGKATVEREATHAFPAPALAPIILSQLSANKGKMKTEDIRLALTPYLRMRPTDEFCKSVKTQARSLLDKGDDAGGTTGDKHQMGQLENYLAALDQLGWATKLFTKSGAELRALLVQNSRRPRTNTRRRSRGRSSSRPRRRPQRPRPSSAWTVCRA